MKALFFAAVLFAGISAQAASPRFGAFTSEGVLYVTWLEDCNSANVGLKVDSSCDENRMTKNYAVRCTAELQVATTRMACHKPEANPVVTAINLDEVHVAREAKSLEIRFGQETVTVEINR